MGTWICFLGVQGVTSEGKETDPELEEALRRSLDDALQEEHDDQMRRAIQASLQDERLASSSASSEYSIQCLFLAPRESRISVKKQDRVALTP